MEEPRLFVLKIELGNAGMLTLADVGAALVKLGAELSNGDSLGYIRDENGNTVGAWTVDRFDETTDVGYHPAIRKGSF